MKNKIFHSNDKGSLDFLADFDSIYQNDVDPWDQSAPEGSVMTSFYSLSRKEAVDFIFNRCAADSLICEVGCGTGYLTNQLSHAFIDGRIYGCDISETAIEKAKKNFNHISFFKHDILKAPLAEKYDVLILSNILWYVIHDMDNLVKNIINSIHENSLVVIQNALFKQDQLYAKEKISSMGTMIDFVSKHFSDYWGDHYTVDSKFIRSEKLHHDFGILSIHCKGLV